MVAIGIRMGGTKGGLGCRKIAEMNGEVAVGVERGPRGTPCDAVYDANGNILDPTQIEGWEDALQAIDNVARTWQ